MWQNVPSMNNFACGRSAVDMLEGQSTELPDTGAGCIHAVEMATAERPASSDAATRSASGVEIAATMAPPADPTNRAHQSPV